MLLLIIIMIINLKECFEEKIIIIIMGLESVSASEDVIGDLPLPWAIIKIGDNPQRIG